LLDAVVGWLKAWSIACASRAEVLTATEVRHGLSNVAVDNSLAASDQLAQIGTSFYQAWHW
jgi:hypothetical protein